MNKNALNKLKQHKCLVPTCGLKTFNESYLLSLTRVFVVVVAMMVVAADGNTATEPFRSESWDKIL